MTTSGERTVSFSCMEDLLNNSNHSVPKSHERGIQDLSTGLVLSHALPTVDLHAVDLQNLHSACVEWGFFQVINHDVSAALVAKTKEAIEEFFLLPMEEKLKNKIPVGGYEGYGNIVRGDGKYDWCERIYATSNPKQRRTMFNELPLFLRDTVDEYLAEMQKVVMKIVRHLGEALEIDILEMFDDGFQSLRLNFYPPCPHPDSVMGNINHSDINGITILSQMNGVNGLEIKKDGEWIKAMVGTDALLVNVGDMFEIMSNGIYKSVEHRAMVNSERTRISLALFVSPKFETEVGPMASTIGSNSTPLFETVSVEKYVREFLTSKVSGKSNLERYRVPKVN